MKFFELKEVGCGELYYGTSLISKIVPPYRAIPKEYKQDSNKWVMFIEDWFRHGLDKDAKLIPKEGVEKEPAIRHIQCLLNSYLIDHRHKIAGAACLCGLWFEDVRLGD